jgi:hypothetical protein
MASPPVRTPVPAPEEVSRPDQPVAPGPKPIPSVEVKPATGSSHVVRRGRVAGVAVKGSARVSRGSAVVSFRMTGPATVRIVLERRVCRRSACRWVKTRSWQVHAGDGVRRVSLRSRTPHRGAWRVTVGTGGSDRRSARFTVAR